jgi:hypothetical protein
MAEIEWSALVELLRKDPLYETRKLDVPVEQAFYLRFGEKPQSVRLSSQVFEACDGNELVIDMGNDGKVYGIEII